MKLFGFLVLGLLTGYVIGLLMYSWYSPKIRQAVGIMFLGKLFTVISNIDGKKVYTGKSDPNLKLTQWDLIDGESKSNIFGLPINLYFYPWPFFKKHYYDLTYVKAKKKGEEAPGDTIVWESKDHMDILVSRTNISDHLEYRSTYPMISDDFETTDFGTFKIKTDNVLELENPGLAINSINNWMSFSSNVLDGAFRGIVSTRNVVELNQVSSGQGSFSFNGTVVGIVNGKTPAEGPKKIRLGDVGFNLARTVFKDIVPVGEKTIAMMNAISQIMIDEKLGDAAITKAKKQAKVIDINATAEASAYSKKQAAIVEWQEKSLKRTGLAEYDASGKITKLLPDANTKAWSDAMKELSKITGTLVMDVGAVSKMINLNSPRS